MKTSRYYEIKYSETKALICVMWNSQTEKMSEEEFKIALLEILKFIQENVTKFYLADTRTFLFTIIPEIQDWINQNFIPQVVQTGLKKMAVLNSVDVFAQFSIEQLLEDDVTGLRSKHFQSMEEALLWLK